MLNAGYIYVLCAAALWALIGPLSKQVISLGVSPLEAAFWRSAIGWSFFAAHALATGAWRLQRKDAPAIASFGIIGVSTLFGAYVLSINMIGAALASVLLYTAPAWVAVLAWLTLGEKMHAHKLVALFMTLAGVACVSLGPALVSGKGPGRGEPAGHSAGAVVRIQLRHVLHLRKTLPGPLRHADALPVRMPCACLRLLPFVTLTPKSGETWLFLTLLAATTTYGAYSRLLRRAQKTLGHAHGHCGHP
jgi:drug/metabolite transporter (DMT)-like permease